MKGSTILIAPRGFCAGVVRAIKTVEEALRIYGPPVYVRRRIVHNDVVVDDLRRFGAIFVQDVDDVPDGSVLVFSAHGVAADVVASAKSRRFRMVIDATCPLVTKVHRDAQRFSADGYSVLLIGRDGHDEVLGTLGQAPQIRLIPTVEVAQTVDVPDANKVAVINQTTLGPYAINPRLDVLRQRFPRLQTPKNDDTCVATRKRQDAVRAVAPDVDLVLVVGSTDSENSNELTNVARENGCRSALINGPRDIRSNWFEGATKIAVTAGASAKEEIVQHAIRKLDRAGFPLLEERVVSEENVTFALPTIKPVA